MSNDEFPNPYLQCAGRRTMDLLEPRVEDIHVPSMAWSLAHLNRYTGHGGRYSVAEHSVLGCRWLLYEGYSKRVQLGYLFHDAHEAYTSDVSQPAKRTLRMIASKYGAPDIWKEFEKLHADNVAAFLGFDPHDAGPEVLDVDLSMLTTETDQLESMGGRVGPGWPDFQALPIIVRQWTGDQACAYFLEEVERLAPHLLTAEGRVR